MILGSVIIKAYFVMTSLTIVDEVWNLTNPRPYPKKIYYSLQWEELDFYKVNGQWVLRTYRETDSETKKIVRERYWKRKK